MNAAKLFKGIYPAIVSPIGRDGEVLETELRELVQYFCSTDITGLYVCGGTGEGILLSVARRKRITEIIVDEAGKHRKDTPLQIIVHVGAAEAENTQELAEHASQTGADALSAIPPIYYSYSTSKICEYYRWLAGTTDLPLIVYASAQSGFHVTTDILRELAAIPSIKGIKFTGYNFYEMLKFSEATPDDFSILNGGDEVMIFGLLAGADGGIGATYNVMPERFCRLYAYWLNGDIQAARAEQRTINTVIDHIVSYPVIGAVKFMLKLKGFPVGGPVFPNDDLSDAQKAAFILSLKQTVWMR